MRCPDCGSDLPRGVDACPDCGRAIDADSPTVTGAGADADADADTGADPGSGDGARGGSAHDRGDPAAGTDRGEPTGVGSRDGADDPAPRGTPVPVVGGVLAGGLAAPVGYAAVYALQALDRAAASRSGTAVDLPATRTAGRLFYRAHGTPIVGGSAGPVRADAWSALPGVAPALAVAVVVLVAGHLLARRVLGRRREQRGWVTRREGAKVGAALAVGYVPATVAGAVALHAAPSIPSVARVAAATLVLSVVLGAVGGVLAGR